MLRVVSTALVEIVALSLGVLAAYAQSEVPPDLNSLANSSASLALVAFGKAEVYLGMAGHHQNCLPSRTSS